MPSETYQLQFTAVFSIPSVSPRIRYQYRPQSQPSNPYPRSPPPHHPYPSPSVVIPSPNRPPVPEPPSHQETRSLSMTTGHTIPLPHLAISQIRSLRLPHPLKHQVEHLVNNLAGREEEDREATSEDKEGEVGYEEEDWGEGEEGEWDGEGVLGVVEDMSEGEGFERGEGGGWVEGAHDEGTEVLGQRAYTLRYVEKGAIRRDISHVSSSCFMTWHTEGELRRIRLGVRRNSRLGVLVSAL